MTNGNDNAFAYASFDQEGRINEVSYGLTKREYFAAMAMNGICSDHTFVRPNEGNEIALRAVEIADALINELKRESLA